MPYAEKPTWFDVGRRQNGGCSTCRLGAGLATHTIPLCAITSLTRLWRDWPQTTYSCAFALGFGELGPYFLSFSAQSYRLWSWINLRGRDKKRKKKKREAFRYWIIETYYYSIGMEIEVREISRGKEPKIQRKYTRCITWLKHSSTRFPIPLQQIYPWFLVFPQVALFRVCRFQCSLLSSTSSPTCLN